MTAGTAQWILSSLLIAALTSAVACGSDGDGGDGAGGQPSSDGGGDPTGDGGGAGADGGVGVDGAPSDGGITDGATPSDGGTPGDGGAGIATALSNIFLFCGLALAVTLNRKLRRFHLFGRWWRADWPRLAALWRLGLPIGAAIGFEITVFNAAVFLMGQFGTAAIAAHSIAIQIASASFMVPLGIGQAATVRVGRAHGACDAGGIARAGWTAFALAMAFMTTMSVVMMTVPNLLIGAFIDIADPANRVVAQTAATFLFCAAVFQIADGAQTVGAGMLRGLQDTRVPMIYAGLGYWGVGMPMSLFFGFRMGLEGLGIWIGLATGLAVVAVVMMARWIRRDRLGLVPARS